MYLMKKMGWDYKKCLALCQSKRSIIKPNPGIIIKKKIIYRVRIATS